MINTLLKTDGRNKHPLLKSFRIVVSPTQIAYAACASVSLRHPDDTVTVHLLSYDLPSLILIDRLFLSSLSCFLDLDRRTSNNNNSSSSRSRSKNNLYGSNYPSQLLDFDPLNQQQHHHHHYQHPTSTSSSSSTTTTLPTIQHKPRTI